MRTGAHYYSKAALFDSAWVFLFTCALIYPLFSLEYLDNWASIESAFISHARVLREHLPHPSWLPLWYSGTRFDYIYPPALHYGTALISLGFGVSTARAYHLYTAILYALGIAGVYWLAYAGTRSRPQAWLASSFTALLSPVFLLLPHLRHDSPFYVPQRLHVLMSYGEGPHISALSLLGITLAVSIVALRRWNPVAFVASGVLAAAVVSTNFYGATALAILFPILAWAVFLEARQPGVWLRAAAVAAVAYGLCASWLTPSYLRVTQLNLHWVATPGKAVHIAAAICFVVIFCVVSFYATARRRDTAWPVFLWGSAIILAIYVLGWNYFKFSVTGDPQRLAPELDLALILLGTYYLSTAWRRPMLRSGIVVLLCLASYPAIRYVRHAWTIFPSTADVRERVEFQTSKWMHDHLPDARAFASGSIRFWYDTWYNDNQVYGNSNQGMLNQILPHAVFQIVSSANAELAVAWLQALGADAVIVSDNTSQEWYHDYSHPEKFKGLLDAIYDDHKGNVIYRIPRRYPEIARVVERSTLLALGPPTSGDALATLTRYVAAVERGPDSPVTFQRTNFETIDLKASTIPGQAVLLQETFDTAWHAYSEGRQLIIERDRSMGFMLIQALPGTHAIQLRFETPLENRLGLGLTAVTGVFLLTLICAAARRRFRT